MDLLSAESAHVGKQSLNSSKGKEDSAKSQPPVVAITDKESTGKVWREGLEDRCVVMYEVLQRLVSARSGYMEILNTTHIHKYQTRD